MPRPRHDQERNDVLKALRLRPKRKSAALAQEMELPLSFVNLVRQELRHLNATYAEDPEGWHCSSCQLFVRNVHVCKDAQTPWDVEDERAAVREDFNERKQVALDILEQKRSGEDYHWLDPVREAWENEKVAQPSVPLYDHPTGPTQAETIQGEIVDPDPGARTSPVLLADIPSLTVRQALITLSRAIRDATELGRAPYHFAEEAQDPKAALEWSRKIMTWMLLYRRTLAKRVNALEDVKINEEGIAEESE